MEPQYTLLGTYTLEDEGVKWTAIVELDTAPCRCPNCGEQGEKEKGCPTCPGFWYE